MEKILENGSREYNNKMKKIFMKECPAMNSVKTNKAPREYDNRNAKSRR